MAPNSNPWTVWLPSSGGQKNEVEKWAAVCYGRPRRETPNTSWWKGMTTFKTIHQGSAILSESVRNRDTKVPGISIGIEFCTSLGLSISLGIKFIFFFGTLWFPFTYMLYAHTQSPCIVIHMRIPFRVRVIPTLNECCPQSSLAVERTRTLNKTIEWITEHCLHLIHFRSIEYQNPLKKWEISSILTL